MYEIYINDELLDGVIPGQDIAISKALNNLNNIESRSGAFTTQIEVRKTALNNQRFNNAHMVGSMTNAPYERLSARIQQGSIVLIIGFAWLEAVNQNYVFRIIGSSSDFYNLTKEKPLYELNLSRFNHFWDATNIIANRGGFTDWTDGYIYPDIDYGKFTFTSSNNVKSPDLYVSVFVKMLIYQMCVDVGFLPEGDFYEENELFNSMILPFCGVAPKYNKLYQQQKQLRLLNNEVFEIIPGAPIQLEFNLVEDDWGGGYNAGTGVLSFTEQVIDLNGEFYLPYFLDLSSSGSPTYWPQITVYALTNAGGFGIAFINTLLKPAGFTFDGFTGLFKFSLSELGFDNVAARLAARGTEITFWMNIADPASRVVSFDILSGASFNINVGDTTYPGGTWDIASNLPDLNCGDVLMTVANQFGLLIDANTLTKSVKLIPFNNIDANKSVAIDWSDKISQEPENELTFLFQNYGQRSEFKYLHDENDPFLTSIPEYGNGFIHVNDKILPNKAVVYESKFAPLLRINSFINATTKVMAFIGMFEPTDPTISISPKPRIAYLRKELDNGANSILIEQDLEESNELYIFGRGGGAVVGSTFSLGVYFDDLRFNEYLLPTYYQPLTNILTKVKSFKLATDLRGIDFATIDFSVPVYLDCHLKEFGQIQGYFYINLIDQFKINTHDTTMVEYVRI